ncbi:lysozyme inhibitor LprI family protein [Allorhizobium undicola]|uniref:lysozyme inhibitor LprI family protein n=1 Tax=Allorhizobium undicola TaxID=78527 RepID=UPI003D355DC7
MKILLPALALVLSGLVLPVDAGAQQPKFNCTDPQTQQDMNFCAGEDYNRADRDLNRIYKRAMAWAEEQDTYWKDTDEDKVGAVNALKKAQRAWIDYRDGHCDTYGFQARGGSMEPQLVASCLTDLTKARTRELQELYKETGR